MLFYVLNKNKLNYFINQLFNLARVRQFPKHPFSPLSCEVRTLTIEMAYYKLKERPAQAQAIFNVYRICNDHFCL